MGPVRMGFQMEPLPSVCTRCSHVVHPVVAYLCIAWPHAESESLHGPTVLLGWEPGALMVKWVLGLGQSGKVAVEKPRDLILSHLDVLCHW